MKFATTAFAGALARSGLIALARSSAGTAAGSRVCARPRGFPQVIHPAKRFAGPTGLENMSASASA